jgi:cytochrome c-type biogenesis protein CcsB
VRNAGLSGISFFLIGLLLASGVQAAAPMDSLRYLHVQDSGRIKPYDTFARESLQLIYGSQTYKERSAVEVVTTWILLPDYWDQQKIVQMPHRGLKEALKLNVDEKYFTAVEIMSSDRLGLVMQELQAFRQAKDRLTPYMQAVQRLEGQISVYSGIKSGRAVQVVPPAEPKAQAVDINSGANSAAQAAGNATEGSTEARPGPVKMGAPQKADGGAVGSGVLKPENKWLSIPELSPELQQEFAKVMKAFVGALPKREGDPSSPPLLAKDGETAASLDAAVAQFISKARAVNPRAYGTDEDIKIEVHYKEAHLFLWAWICYLLAAILLGLSWQSGNILLGRLGWLAVLAGFVIHTYGFGLRMYITGRPPVSNMYETVIWVSWGAIVISAFFEFLQRRKFILLAGSIVGVLCLVLADSAPVILDASLQPLEPVLRSNLWLTIHVLTITLAYSGFFLSWALGNIGLGYFLRGEKATSERVKDITLAIYRGIQVGIVLLAAGIILGGVWADYSWGRFWGWDPKETWALIALLGYIALLHARLSGWVQNFGMMAWSIVAFNLVIMSWYGVNFVLGAGLHSYGFGAGGVQYVGAFVILNLIYVLYATFVKRAYLGMSKK